MIEHYKRTLAMLRQLEATSTVEEKRTLARDLRIGDEWPLELRVEAQAVMERIQAGGVAPPSWGHAHSVLDMIRR